MKNDLFKLIFFRVTFHVIKTQNQHFFHKVLGKLVIWTRYFKDHLLTIERMPEILPGLLALIVKLSLSHRYPGSGVVLDLIIARFLPFFLIRPVVRFLCILKLLHFEIVSLCIKTIVNFSPF